jgi:antitoxin (DNA-binding transcriptional repressor) of toxin-antitoxin stability system
MTKTVDIIKAKTQLSKLLSLALKGNEVIITEGKKPLAKIIPVVPSQKTRIAGLNRGKIWTSNDFDEPLPKRFWMRAL